MAGRNKIADLHLQEVISLTNIFENSIRQKILADPALLEKSLAAMKPGEMDALNNKLHEIHWEGQDYMIGGAFGRWSEHYCKLCLEFNEMDADLALRFMPMADVVACMPDKITGRDVQKLRDHGAPNLARIAERKL